MVNKNICPFGKEYQKYWNRRHKIFTLFNRGIKIDKLGLRSTTQEQIAREQAKKFNCPVVVDAFCSVGGNAIAFARNKSCRKVYAIEINKERLEMAKNNAKIYGVDKKIKFIRGDFYKLIPKIKADGIFLDPFWGVNHSRIKKYKFFNLGMEKKDMLEVALKYAKKVAIKLPKQFALSELSNFNKPYIVEKNKIGNKILHLTIYFGI